eukprot:Nitzschia sp. Nitz4//scaffold417_size9038//5284//6563//NITZ4_009107-RA/size9038-augustus-gene-0.0-mRNA-1//1//CDS//3329551377//2133//frame0
MTSFWVAFLLLLLQLAQIDGFLIGGLLCSRCLVPPLGGWVKNQEGEWDWEEDDPNYVDPVQKSEALKALAAKATPRLPSGQLKPKQSLGQNYLKDPNTVAKIIRTFDQDATRGGRPIRRIIELGPGAGALTDRLVERYGAEKLQCIEIDRRAIDILNARYPNLSVVHQDVLQINYPELAERVGEPLVVVGNLPYYITSQILFALADASHFGAVHCATVTMQWEVALRMVAPAGCKDYGILSVVFQTYADVRRHFKLPPTVFYPQPKVDSALIGLHFIGPKRLRQRLAGVNPKDFRAVVTTAFRQRRKTLRNSLKSLLTEPPETYQPQPLPKSVIELQKKGDEFAQQQFLPPDWLGMRAEQLEPAQFVELTRAIMGVKREDELGRKVWRKKKHGI